VVLKLPDWPPALTCGQLPPPKPLDKEYETGGHAPDFSTMNRLAKLLKPPTAFFHMLKKTTCGVYCSLFPFARRDIRKSC
jgi:hypothetical protein